MRGCGERGLTYRTFRRTSNQLRVLRLERRWSQDVVATKLGYPSKFKYWQLENAKRIPTLLERLKLERIFGVDDSDIFPALAA